MDTYHRVEADIDLSAIYKNIETMKGCIPEGKKLLAVIKANAYGHGSIQVAETLDDLADYYGVACIEEALELRKAGVIKPILILGYTDPGQYEMLVKNDITQTIYSYEQAERLSEVSGNLNMTGKLHIKLDTGMNRIGFKCDEDNMKESINEIIKISTLDNINMEGIFTHYYKADSYEKISAIKQLAQYTRMVDELEKEGVHFAIRHISNSAGIMEMPNDTYDMVRSGISTYGLYPSEEMDKEACVLYPAMSLKSHITHVKMVKKGETVGYGGTYELPCDQLIATVGVGYADGYPRALSNKGRVLIHGEYAPVVGRVCMDQIMVEVTDIEDVNVGDEVVLFGKQKDNSIPVEEIADMSSSFNYEFVCDINRRVPRVFFKDGKKILTVNYLLDEKY